jgi:hypothetical protein
LASTRPNLTRHFKCNLYHIYGTDIAMEDEGYVKILVEYTYSDSEFYFFAYVKTNMLKNHDGLRELPIFLTQQEPLFHAS